MLIQSLKQHFPARLPEWWMSGVMVSLGCYFVLHPQLFTQPATAALFAGMREMADCIGYPASGVWGGTLLIVGLLRMSALFINGAYARTPIVRLICSFISAIVWLLFVIGLRRSDVANTGLVIYPFIVLLDVASAYRASCDAVIAEYNRGQTGAGRAATAGGR